MIISKNDLKKVTIENPKNGTGIMNKIEYISGKQIKNKINIIMENELDIDAMVGEHFHKNDEEFYYIISGNGEVIDNGKIKNVMSGDLIYTGYGHSHSLKNIGSTKLKFLAFIINK